MQTVSFCLAGLKIRAEVRFEQTRTFLGKYRTENTEDADLFFEITEELLEKERMLAKEQQDRGKGSAAAPRDAYLETLALYRLIAEELPRLDRLLLHASALSFEGQGALFLARSGGGKSTHAALYRSEYPDRVQMINDDKPVLWFREDGIYACGTPWSGKHRISRPIAVPLKAAALVVKAKDNRMEEIPSSLALPEFFAQTYRPESAEALGKTLSLLKRLSETVPLYRLDCTKDPEAARLSKSILFGKIV